MSVRRCRQFQGTKEKIMSKDEENYKKIAEEVINELGLPNVTVVLVKGVTRGYGHNLNWYNITFSHEENLFDIAVDYTELFMKHGSTSDQAVRTCIKDKLQMHFAAE